MRVWTACIVVFLFIPVARADDIELVSGEILTGVTIIEQRAEVFIVEHPILGQLEIPVAAIRTINDKPINIILIPTQPPDQPPDLPPPDQPKPDQPPVETPPAPLPTDQTPRADQPSATEPPAKTPEDQPQSTLRELPPPPPPEVPPVPWRSVLELGGNITDGATETTNFTTKFSTTQTKPFKTTRVNMNYRIATDRRQRGRNVNRFDIGLFSEMRDEDSRWNIFTQGRYEIAEFEAWDQRLTASGGLGYQFMDVKGVDEGGATVDLFKLTGRLGSGLRQEYGSDNNQVVPEGLLGLDFDYRVSATQRITGNSRYYPDLDQGGELRIESNLNWTIDLDQMRGVSLRLGFQHEYDSQRPASIPKNDYSARVTLVISF